MESRDALPAPAECRDLLMMVCRPIPRKATRFVPFYRREPCDSWRGFRPLSGGLPTESTTRKQSSYEAVHSSAVVLVVQKKEVTATNQASRVVAFPLLTSTTTRKLWLRCALGATLTMCTTQSEGT